MSSVPSNVAAHATATSAPDHPVWFHHVPYSRLENYLEHNLVVEADKDSSLALMSRTLCLREAQLNMDSVFNNAPVYQFLGPPSYLTHWVDKGHAWQRKLASWLLHFYPDHLREVGR